MKTSQKTELHSNHLSRSEELPKKLGELKERNYQVNVKTSGLKEPLEKINEYSHIEIFTPESSKMRQKQEQNDNLITVPLLSSVKKEQPSQFDSKYFQTILRSNLTEKSSSKKGFSDLSGRLYSRMSLNYADQICQKRESVLSEQKPLNCVRQGLQGLITSKKESNTERKQSSRSILKKHSSVGEHSPRNKSNSRKITIDLMSKMDSNVFCCNQRSQISEEESDTKSIVFCPNYYQSSIENMKTNQKQSSQKPFAKEKQNIPTDKKDRSQKKMSLRDYLYTTQTTAKKALIKRRESTNQLLKDSVKSTQEGMTPIHSAVEKKFSAVANNYRSQKYEQNPIKMQQILKSDIRNDMNSLVGTMKLIEKQLSKIPISQEIPNHQLMTLYDLRRTIKEEMTTKLECILSELTEQNEEKKGSKISVNSSQRFTEI